MKDAQSKIMKIFKKHNSLENYFVKIYDPDSYFRENHKEKLRIDEVGVEYIVFKIDIYFSEFLLAVEIDKNLTDRDIIFEEKRLKEIELKLDCEFIKINLFQYGSRCDLDYELDCINHLLVILKIEK